MLLLLYFLSTLAKNEQNVKQLQSSLLFSLERSDKTDVYLREINILHGRQKDGITFLQFRTL